MELQVWLEEQKTLYKAQVHASRCCVVYLKLIPVFICVFTAVLICGLCFIIFNQYNTEYWFGEKKMEAMPLPSGFRPPHQLLQLHQNYMSGVKRED